MQRQKMLELAVVFYIAAMLIAVVWAWIAGRPLLWQHTRPSLYAALQWTAIGVFIGLAVVGLSNLAFRQFEWADDLGHWFAQALGPLRWRDAFLLAWMSGFGEELLFRGAIQPTAGLIITSILFGAIHVPPSRKLLPWTISAGLLGLLFGWLVDYSGHLSVAISAHFTINLLNLKAVSREYGGA